MAADYLQQKYIDIRKDFKSMHDDGYRSQVIIKKLSKKYYMAESTIEDIVYQTGRYGSRKVKIDENQLDIFGNDNE